MYKFQVSVWIQVVYKPNGRVEYCDDLLVLDFSKFNFSVDETRLFVAIRYVILHISDFDFPPIPVFHRVDRTE
jgi:hypothetical protein